MALRCFLQAKLHRARLTEVNVNYTGSIGICPDLLEASGIMVNERVEVYNLDNGNRLSTYVLKGTKGEISLKGAAALKGEVGQEVIIASYAWLQADEIEKHKPTIVLLDSDNRADTVKFG